MNITLQIRNPTPIEQRAMTHTLAKVNAERAANLPDPLPPFANINDYVSHLIEFAMVPSWSVTQAEDKRQDENIDELWRIATDEKRAAAIAALRNA